MGSHPIPSPITHLNPINTCNPSTQWTTTTTSTTTTTTPREESLSPELFELYSSNYRQLCHLYFHSASPLPTEIFHLIDTAIVTPTEIHVTIPPTYAPSTPFHNTLAHELEKIGISSLTGQLCHISLWLEYARIRSEERGKRHQEVAKEAEHHVDGLVTLPTQPPNIHSWFPPTTTITTTTTTNNTSDASYNINTFSSSTVDTSTSLRSIYMAAQLSQLKSFRDRYQTYPGAIPFLKGLSLFLASQSQKEFIMLGWELDDHVLIQAAGDGFMTHAISILKDVLGMEWEWPVADESENTKTNIVGNDNSRNNNDNDNNNNNNNSNGNNSNHNSNHIKGNSPDNNNNSNQNNNINASTLSPGDSPLHKPSSPLEKDTSQTIPLTLNSSNGIIMSHQHSCKLRIWTLPQTFSKHHLKKLSKAVFPSFKKEKKSKIQLSHFAPSGRIIILFNRSRTSKKISLWGFVLEWWMSTWTFFMDRYHKWRQGF